MHLGVPLGLLWPTNPPRRRKPREPVTPWGARAMKPPVTSSPTLPASAVSSDASLLAAARHDPDAFRGLYGRYAEGVHEYFVRRAGSRATALDRRGYLRAVVITALTVAFHFETGRRARRRGPRAHPAWRQ